MVKYRYSFLAGAALAFLAFASLPAASQSVSGGGVAGAGCTFGTTAGTCAQGNDSRIVGAAPLASPALTGTPTAPTPSTSDDSTAIATTAFVKAQGYGAAGTGDTVSSNTSITQTQFNNFHRITVSNGSTVTLPSSTGLDAAAGGVVILTQNSVVPLAATGSDTITMQGSTTAAAGSVNLPPNSTVIVSTDAAGNYRVGAATVTGTGNKVLSASPTFTGTITAASLNLSGNLGTNVTGSTQCLHVNSSGIVSGTGADCGAGGGGSPGGSDTQVQFNNGGAFGAIAPLTWDGATLSYSQSGGSAAPALTFTGAPYNAGTGTTNRPMIYINGSVTQPTNWNSGGTYLGGSTVSGFAGNVIDFRSNGGSNTLFSVNYLGQATFGNAITVSGVNAGIGNVIRWGAGSGTTMQSSTNGILRLSNGAVTDFDRIQLGGTSSSFPAIKRDGTGIDIRLADDSGNSFLAVSHLKMDALTFATLPGTPSAGWRAFITDASACTYGSSVSGGGSAKCSVVYDGTNWIAG